MSEISPISGTLQHEFTLLTNHALVLIVIAQFPSIRMREIAANLGITERAVQRIVDDLTTHGYIMVTKDGRRNRYEVNSERTMLHPLTRHRNVGDFIRFVGPPFQA